MRTIQNLTDLLKTARRMVLLALVIFSAFSAEAVEQTFPLLRTKTTIYTNVTVTTKAKGYIFILHSAGMANLKVQDLSTEAQEELGYIKRANSSSQPAIVMAKQIIPSVESRLKPYREQLSKQIPWTREQLRPSRNVLYIALAIAALIYLFFCYCCHLICIKSKKEASIFAWIPGFQLIPLLRAANMSSWWFVASILPPIGLIVSILWAFNIAKVRGKNAILAILLILPITNILAFLYLAFSQEAPSDDTPRYQSMSLQTA